MSTQVSIVLEWGFLNTCTELAFLPSRIGRAVGLLRLVNEVRKRHINMVQNQPFNPASSGDDCSPSRTVTVRRRWYGGWDDGRFGAGQH